jgi:hypothetical protein
MTTCVCVAGCKLCAKASAFKSSPDRVRGKERQAGPLCDGLSDGPFNSQLTREVQSYVCSI